MGRAKRDLGLALTGFDQVFGTRRGTLPTGLFSEPGSEQSNKAVASLKKAWLSNDTKTVWSVLSEGDNVNHPGVVELLKFIMPQQSTLLADEGVFRDFLNQAGIRSHYYHQVTNDRLSGLIHILEHPYEKTPGPVPRLKTLCSPAATHLFADVKRGEWVSPQEAQRCPECEKQYHAMPFRIAELEETPWYPHFENKHYQRLFYANHEQQMVKNYQELLITCGESVQQEDIEQAHEKAIADAGADVLLLWSQEDGYDFLRRVSPRGARKLLEALRKEIAINNDEIETLRKQDPSISLDLKRLNGLLSREDLMDFYEMSVNRNAALSNPRGKLTEKAYQRLVKGN